MVEKHKEIVFEKEIVEYLTVHGWQEGDHEKYNRELALYPEDVIGWIKDTQPQAWEKFTGQHGPAAEQKLLSRLADVLDKGDGSIEVLRQGFKDVSYKFDMCQFRPSSGLNPEIVTRYNAVRLRVVRQVHYSLHNENSIDLVFFVNGIPVATAELKTDFTQTIHDAIKQYKYDRPPKDYETRREEPLLAFKRRALVHFAVSTDEIYMATRLEGKSTFFLPFNQGNDGGAGNPINPEGYRTAYLWERILQRDTWLNILGRFIHLEKVEKENKEGRKEVIETLIFPRFHQWEVVTKLISAVKAEKAGKRYLVQHSAGSGKTNSISWLSHRLASLHDADSKKVFDAVIVVTDRTVLDSQLRDAIYQIEHKKGVVLPITSDRGSKSEQLVEALTGANPAQIIIVTLQTFPFVLEAIQQEGSLKSRTFAVIADEAHSSQTGNAAKKLKQVLTAEEFQEVEEGGEVGFDDLLVAEMQSRAQPKNISFFAFTATPKGKTLEMFGRPGPDGKPVAFHLYTMQQAIEEGFILDVLKNYTPYKLAFKLAHNGKDYDDETVEKSEAVKSIMRWVRLHPYNISQKVQIIIEHFRQNVMWLLDGEAKAMVVTASRKEAVRYKLAMDKYIRENSYRDIGTLVAFSGEVIDPESGFDAFTEGNMNPGLKRMDIREGLNTKDFNVLIVANKYQTGFDQPKLVAMYVDKKLSGVAAVQTLSRLNRTRKGKDKTFILDFVNNPDDIRKAFEPYYRKTELLELSDPNLIHELQAKLDAAHIYTDQEIDLFVRAFFEKKQGQKDMQRHIAPAVDRYRELRRRAVEENNKKEKEALDIFVKDLGTFVRAYDFLSQIIDYNDTALEKHSIFFRYLIPWLREEKGGDAVDLSEIQMTHYKLRKKDAQEIKLGDDDENKLNSLTGAGGREARDPVMVAMREIVTQMNDLFEGELTEADYIGFTTYLSEKMMESEVLAKQAAANTKEQFATSPDLKRAMKEAAVAGVDNHQEMVNQVLNDERKTDKLLEMLAELVYLRFAERRNKEI